jgi:hypothetical protein
LGLSEPSIKETLRMKSSDQLREGWKSATFLTPSFSDHLKREGINTHDIGWKK